MNVENGNKHTWNIPGMCYLLTIVVLITCCNVKSDFISTITYKTDSLEVKTDSIIAFSYTSASLLSTDSNQYLYLSDPFLRLISVIDLNNYEFIFNIRLKEEGPNAIQNLGWIQPLSLDTIVSVSNDYFYMIDKKGKLIKKVFFNGSNNDLSDFDFTQYKPLLTSNNSLLKNDSILILAKAQLQRSPSKNNFYKYPLLISYNYVTDNFNDLEVYFPEKYRSNSHNYDLNTYPIVTINKSKIFFNYPFSDAVFSLTNDEVVTIYNTQNMIDPLPNYSSNDIVKKTTYMETSPKYKALLFDDKNDVIYQLYNLKKNHFGESTEFKVIVRDSDFKILTEVLPKEDLFPTAFVYDGKLFFRRRNAEVSDESINFIYYEFSIKN